MIEKPTAIYGFQSEINNHQSTIRSFRGSRPFIPVQLHS
jgi:hypothetical protein